MYSFSHNVKYFPVAEEDVVERKRTPCVVNVAMFTDMQKSTIILCYQENPEQPQPNNQRVQVVLHPRQNCTLTGEIDLDKRFVYTIEII